MERLNDREKEIVIPYDIIKTMKEDYGFNKEYINALISDKEVLDYFLAITRTFPLYLKRGDHEVVGDFPKLIAKWIVGPIAAWMKENLKAIKALPFSPDQFNTFLTKAQEGSLMENQLKIIMESMLST